MMKPGTTSMLVPGLGLMLLGVLTGMAGPSPVEAQTARDRAGTPAPQAARLAGRVVDAADGRQGVRRAIVTMTGKPFPAGRSAITDDQGRFSFERVPAGEFTLLATRPGYIKAAYGAGRPGRPGTPVAMTPGRDVLEVTLVMSHGSAIDGVLRDTVGDPAPGMRVEAVRILHGRTGDRGETAGVSLTDDRGEYRLFGLSAGDYVVVATPAAIISGIGDIGAPSEAEVDALFAALQRRGGGPAAPPPSPGTRAPSSLPAMKGYSTPPTYYPGVLASGEATRISLGPNDDREGADFSVRMSHSAAIDGQIVPIRGLTVPQLQIGIHGAGPELPVFGGSASGPSVSSRASDRTFHISNVPPGHYRITARTFGAPGSSTTVISSGGALPSTDSAAGVQWAIADVDVAGDDLSGVTLSLQPALHVTGRLTFDAATLRPPGAASVRISLEPLADDDNGSNGLTMALPGTVRSDGTFEFPAVIPGGYRIVASVAGGWWLRSAMLNAVDVLDGGLRIGASDVGGLTLTLSDRHTAIAGTLSGTTGRPATDYFVVAFPADRAMWRAPSRRVLSTRPATTGAFELSDLPPGAYCLAVLTDIEPADLDDPSFLESLLPVALTISIGEGERKIQNMRIGGLPASDVQPLMEEFNRALGVSCTYCHVGDQWRLEDKPQLSTARGMYRMVKALGDELLKDRGGLTCWTCHRGQAKPSRFPGTELDGLLAKWPAELAASPDGVKLTMTVYTRSLGVTCEFCHVAADWKSRAKAPMAVVPVMLELFDEIPKYSPVAANRSQCWMCHKGSTSPERRPRTS